MAYDLILKVERLARDKWIDLVRWKMPEHVVTITLPEMVYEQIRQAAERSHRPVDDVLAEAVTAAAPVLDAPSGTLRSALAHLAYLNDAALWQAARATMLAEQRERLATLHEKQQRKPLTAEERTEEQALLALYRETLLVRGQAAILLRKRGYDISDPQQFTPLA